jgi:hypothetical protein
MFRFFKLGISDLVNLLNWTISQLQDRAAEKIASAEGRVEAALGLVAAAAAERLEAKVAVNMADKMAKLLK